MIVKQTSITNFLKVRCHINPQVKAEDNSNSQQMPEKQTTTIPEAEKLVLKQENSVNSSDSSSEKQVANQVGQSDESGEYEQEDDQTQRQLSSDMKVVRKYTYTHGKQFTFQIALDDYAKMCGLKLVPPPVPIEPKAKNYSQESLDVGKFLFDPKIVTVKVQEEQNLNNSQLENSKIIARQEVNQLVQNQEELHLPDQAESIQKQDIEKPQNQLADNQEEEFLSDENLVFKQEPASQMFEIHKEDNQNPERGVSFLMEAAQMDSFAQNEELKQVPKRLYSAREVVNLYERRWLKIKQQRMTGGCDTAKEYFKNYELTYQQPITKKQSQIRKKLLRLCTKPKEGEMRQLEYEFKGTLDHINFFQNPNKVTQCPMCYKYCTRFRKERHEECFSTQDALYYRFISINNEYCCLICFCVTESATEMAKHMSNFHHPLDLKFFGYHAHILKRTDHQSFQQMTKEITGGEKKVPVVKDFSQFMQKQFKELGCHLSSEQPFLSLIQPFTEHILSFPRPLDTDYFVYVSVSKVAILYSTTLFKHNIYGGLSYDEMVQTYLKLGLNQDSGFYRTCLMEQTTDTFAFVGKFAVEKIRLQLQPLKQWLDENMNSTAQVFCSMLDAITYLYEQGLYVIQGMQLDYWHYDVVQNRSYFLAPHWFQNDLQKANQVGHLRIRLNPKKPMHSLKGVWGNYSQIVVALYLFLSTKTGFEYKVANVPLTKYQRVRKIIYGDLYGDFRELMGVERRLKFFRPFLKMLKKKSQDPEFYKRVVKYVCKVFNDQQTTKAQDMEFSPEEKEGKKRDRKAESKV